MIVATVAIGTQYHAEVERLKRSVSNEIIVIDENHAQFTQKFADPLINALWHKANFANFLPDANDSVLFIDADAFTLKVNPFETFSVQENTDIAYVKYNGKWYLPDAKRQAASDYHGHKINSGFLYFRTMEIAKDVCTKWQNEYIEREKLYDVEKGTSKYEYDEWALMIALMQTTYKVEVLDRKWNDWELKSEEEIRSSDAIFIQSHNYLDIV